MPPGLGLGRVRHPRRISSPCSLDRGPGGVRHPRRTSSPCSLDRGPGGVRHARRTLLCSLDQGPRWGPPPEERRTYSRCSLDRGPRQGPPPEEERRASSLWSLDPEAGRPHNLVGDGDEHSPKVRLCGEYPSCPLFLKIFPFVISSGSRGDKFLSS